MRKEEEEEEEEEEEFRTGRRRSLIRIVHARGAIPHEVGPARCRATPEECTTSDNWRSQLAVAWRRRRPALGVARETLAAGLASGQYDPALVPVALL